MKIEPKLDQLSGAIHLEGYFEILFLAQYKAEIGVVVEVVVVAAVAVIANCNQPTNQFGSAVCVLIIHCTVRV